MGLTGSGANGTAPVGQTQERLKRTQIKSAGPEAAGFYGAPKAYGAQARGTGAPEARKTRATETTHRHTLRPSCAVPLGQGQEFSL